MPLDFEISTREDIDQASAVANRTRQKKHALAHNWNVLEYCSSTATTLCKHLAL